jgi:predicted ester cyclase
VSANEAGVRRFYEELWNEWRLDVADEILAPDLRFRGTLGTSVVGVDAFKGYVEQTRAAFPDWSCRIDELITADEVVVARIECGGTHAGELLGVAPTGRRVSYPAVGIFRFGLGKITDAYVVGDTQELWRALGATPPAG